MENSSNSSVINNKVINRLNLILDTNNADGDAVFTSMVGFDWEDWEERFRQQGGRFSITVRR